MSDDPVLGGESTEPAPAPVSEGAPAPAAPQPDFSRIESRMEEFARQQAELLERINTTSQPAEPDEDEYLLSPDDEGYEEQEAQRWLDQRINQLVEERLTPLQQQQAIKERDGEFAALLEEIPALQDDATRRPILAKAKAFAESVNPDLVNRPEFVDLIEMFYKAHVADERAARETPAGERREVQLQGAGGAAPSAPEEDPQEAFIKALQARSSSEL